MILLTTSNKRMIKNKDYIIELFMIIDDNLLMILSGGVENTGISLVIISDISINYF